MKKTIQVFSVVLMLGGVAVAGNITELMQAGGVDDLAVSIQTGVKQSVKSTQTSNAGKNTMHNSQSGSDNSVRIDQASNRLSATNFERIKQQGTKNTVGISQSSKGHSRGSANDADVLQKGNDNVVAGANSSGGLASVNPKASQVSTLGRNLMYIDQQGNGNKIGINQKGKWHNAATMTQENDGNIAEAYQKSTLGSNRLTIRQNGGDFSRIVQSGRGVNTASVDQR